MSYMRAGAAAPADISAPLEFHANTNTAQIWGEGTTVVPIPCPLCAQGPLQPLVISLQKAVSETGQALSEAGSSSLGQHIMAVLEDARASG